MFQRSRRIAAAAVLAAAGLSVGHATPARGQDTAATMLQAGNKRLDEATGTTGQERRRILEDAIRIFGEVPERFPDRAEEIAKAHLRMGRIHRSLDDTKQALDCLEKAAAATAHVRTASEALFDIASLHRKEKRYDRARDALSRIEALPSIDAKARARARLSRASLARQEKDFDAAQALAREVISEFPELWSATVDAVDLLVGTLIRAKKLDDAGRELEALTAAVRERFSKDGNRERVERALAKMTCVKSLKRARALASLADDDEGRDPAMEDGDVPPPAARKP